MTFAEYVAVERLFARSAVAVVTGLHRSHVCCAEWGVREPALETIVRLARGLGVSPAELGERWWETV